MIDECMAGKAKWHTSNINTILRNEKYYGDALLQKTYIVDFLTKKRVRYSTRWDTQLRSFRSKMVPKQPKHKTNNTTNNRLTLEPPFLIAFHRTEKIRIDKNTKL